MILLIQGYLAFAFLVAFLSLNTPLSDGLRRRLASACSELFTRLTLRKVIVVLAMVFIALLAFEQPWLMGVLGVTDVAVYLDVVLISAVLGAVSMTRAVLDHLVRLRPWRVLARIGRAPGQRQRRVARKARPPSSDSNDAEPAWSFAMGLAA